MQWINNLPANQRFKFLEVYCKHINYKLIIFSFNRLTSTILWNKPWLYRQASVTKTQQASFYRVTELDPRAVRPFRFKIDYVNFHVHTLSFIKLACTIISFLFVWFWHENMSLDDSFWWLWIYSCTQVHT